MKDIFIDNNLSGNFTNPHLPSYKELISWLLEFNKDKKTDAYLVVSNKLLQEYYSSTRGCTKSTSLPVIIDRLTRQKRIFKISNAEIKDFKKKYFKKKVKKKLLCNNKDKNHIPVILSSHRKFALTKDKNLTTDLRNFPGFSVKVANDPAKIAYR